MFFFFIYLFILINIFIFLSEDNKIAYLYDDVILFLNLIIVATSNTFPATPREGVNGQQYKQIKTSQEVKTIWF